VLAFAKEWSLLKDFVWNGQGGEQLPRGSLALAHRRFLALTPGTGWFYRAAGIGTLTSLTELYAALLLPSNGNAFHALSHEEQQSHVKFIRDRKLLLDDTPHAKALAEPLKALLVQHDRHGHLRRARDLVDCRVPFLATIFALPPKDTPSKDNSKGHGGGVALLAEAASRDKDAMAFLEKLGLRNDIQDLPFLIVCARALARVQGVWKAQGDGCGVTAQALVDAGLRLFAALETFKGEDGVLAQLGRVPFVPVLHSKRTYAYPVASALSTFPLCAIKDLSAPSLSKVQSLVRPVLHAELEGCHKSLESLLWPVGDLDHDTHVVCTIQQLHKLHQLVGTREEELLATHVSPLQGRGGTGLSADTHKETDVSKNERKRMKEKKELEEMIWDSYSELDRVADKKMELLNNVDLIKDELVKFPSIFLSKVGAFVRPDECYTGLSSSIDGVMYAVDGRLEAYPNLIADLQLRDTPSRVQVVEMLKKLRCREASPGCAEACVALLQVHSATLCNTLQHTATHSAGMSQGESCFRRGMYCPPSGTLCNTLQHSATYCNTLQYTATHCNTLQHTALLPPRHLLPSFRCAVCFSVL